MEDMQQTDDPEDLLEAGARLRIATLRLSRQFNVSATIEGLTPTQASVLSVIAFRGPIGLSQLAAIEALNPTMVSRVVGRLDELGLARRVQSTEDLRSASVEVTPLGHETNDRVRAARAHAAADGLRSLSEEHREAILAALPALDALVERLLATRAER